MNRKLVTRLFRSVIPIVLLACVLALAIPSSVILAESSITFPVGTNPRDIAFDGANIWVSNVGSNNVTKLKASDGSLVGTYSVGTAPLCITFDGVNIWVANYYSNTVAKLKASDGSLVGTYSVGSYPVCIASDGASIWVTNSVSNNVTKLKASDGSLVSTYSVGNHPVGIAFDGANIWVANQFSNTVTKLKASDGSLVATYNNVGHHPVGIAFDGANIWVSNNGSNNVTELKASDGSLLGTYSVGTGPEGMAFDGANMWVANYGSNTVTRITPSASPNQPSNVSPANAATWVTLTPTLQSSAFYDPDIGHTHAASQWQITSAAGDYSGPVFDSGTDTVNLAELIVPSETLRHSTTYYWRVRHQDSHGRWSAWSAEASFRTAGGPFNALPLIYAGVSIGGLAVVGLAAYGGRTLMQAKERRRERVRAVEAEAGKVYEAEKAAAVASIEREKAEITEIIDQAVGAEANVTGEEASRATNVKGEKADRPLRSRTRIKPSSG
jgi:outer membrane lipoprotein-sorting protein